MKERKALAERESKNYRFDSRDASITASLKTVYHFLCASIAN